MKKSICHQYIAICRMNTLSNLKETQRYLPGNLTDNCMFRIDAVNWNTLTL